MAAYAITVNGTPRSILVESLNLSEVVSGVDTLQATIRSLDGSPLYRPDINDVVEITEDATVIFAGLIVEVRERGANNAGNLPGILLDINAKSYSVYPELRVVTLTLAADTLKNQLTALNTAYFATYGVAIHASQVIGPVMPDFTFTRRNGNEVLNDLMAAASDLSGSPHQNFVWKIDENKKLRAYAIGTQAAPYNISDSSGPIHDVQIRTTRNDNYANRMFLTVSGAGPATSSEQFTAADGVDDSTYTRFTTKYPAVSDVNTVWPNELYINGVGQGPVMFGFPTGPFAWGWDYTNHQLVYVDASGGAFPVGSDVIDVTYVIGYPFVIQADDVAGQTAYGLAERFEERNQALTLEAAEALANGLLGQQSPILRSVFYDTLELGARPGQTQTVTVSKRGFDELVLISEVTTRWATNALTIRSVTGLDSLTAQATFQSTYQQALQDTAGSGSGGVSQGTGELTRPGGEDQSVQVNRIGAFYGDAYLKYDYGQRFLKLVPAITGGSLQAGLNLQGTVNAGATGSKVGIYDLFTTAISTSLTNFTGIEIDLEHTGSGSLSNMTGQNVLASHSGSGSLTNQLVGQYINADLSGSGANAGVVGLRVDSLAESTYSTTPQATGIELTVDADKAGGGSTAATNAYGINVTVKGAASTEYGLLVSMQGSATTKWGIYSDARIEAPDFSQNEIPGSIILRSVTNLTNAQIKSLPGTPVTLIGSVGAGKRIKLVAPVTLILDNHNGVYTGVDTTYSTLQVGWTSAAWAANVIVNDTTPPVDLTDMTTFFNTISSENRWLVELGIPFSLAHYDNGGADLWMKNFISTAAQPFDIQGGDGRALEISIDNNGSTSDLGGGHASNTMKVIVHYVIEDV